MWKRIRYNLFLRMMSDLRGLNRHNQMYAWFLFVRSLDSFHHLFFISDARSVQVCLYVMCMYICVVYFYVDQHSISDFSYDILFSSVTYQNLISNVFCVCCVLIVLFDLFYILLLILLLKMVFCIMLNEGFRDWWYFTITVFDDSKFIFGILFFFLLQITIFFSVWVYVNVWGK